MGRPPSITDDELLAAARAVFLEKGISGTTLEVAARCHIGEATLFRRFPTKQALFVAAIETEGEPEWAAQLPDRAGRTDLRQNLTEIAHQMIEYGRKIVPLMILRMSNPEHGGNPKQRETRLLRIITMLTDFFAAQIRAGRMQMEDPRVAARVFFGSVQHFVFFETVTRGVDGLPADRLVHGLVELLAGASSEVSTPKRRGARKAAGGERADTRTTARTTARTTVQPGARTTAGADRSGRPATRERAR